MMISPYTYIEKFKDKSYEELLIERDRLIESIKDFEQREPIESPIISPGPDVRYQMELRYLGELCDLIVKKFQEKNN